MLQQLLFLIFFLFSLLSAHLELSAETLSDWEEREILIGPYPTDEIFETLKQKQVKTIVSVDGLAPDLKKAKALDMRYIHLPIGYDGISDERIAQLNTLIRTQTRPIYIHCHHGKHRGPAAAAVALILSGEFNTTQAVKMLETAGTSKEYSGLWQVVRDAQKTKLKQISLLPEKIEVSNMTDQMAQIDIIFDRLKEFRENDWKPLKSHPDTTSAQEALLLREAFVELNRAILKKTDTQGSLKKKFKEYEAQTILFHTSFSAQPSIAKQNALFKALQQDCRSCHRDYRD